MATYIHVNNQAPSLLGRNRADAANNRMRADERLWLRGQAREQAAAEQKAKPVDYAHRRKQPANEEPSASLVNITGMATFWFYLDGFENRNDWRIYSGDTSAFVEGSDYSTGIPSTAASSAPLWSAAWLVLPVKANICIAVMLGRRSDLYGIPGESVTVRGVTCVNRAFTVSTTAVRQVLIPNPLQSIIDNILNPPGIDAQYVDYEHEVVVTNPFPPRQIYNANLGWIGLFYSVSSPTIYELLNLLQQYVNPSMIKAFPPSKNRIANDTRYGASAQDEVDRSRYYAEWTGDPASFLDEFGQVTDPTLLKARPDMTLQLPNDFQMPLPPDSVLSELYGYISQSYGNWTCWDWDDANYCRQMLLALGFTAADLVP